MAVVFVFSSGAMHLEFDNSEDGFFPDDENVDLLNQLESEYQASVDFVRVINDIEQEIYCSIPLGVNLLKLKHQC